MPFVSPRRVLIASKYKPDFDTVDQAITAAVAKGATAEQPYQVHAYPGISRDYTPDPAVSVVFYEDLPNAVVMTPIVLQLTTVAPGATYYPMGDGMTIKTACTVASLQAYASNVESNEDVLVTLYKNGTVASTVTLSGGPEEAAPSGGENTPDTVYAAGDTLSVAFVNSGSVATGIMAVLMLGP